MRAALALTGNGDGGSASFILQCNACAASNNRIPGNEVSHKTLVVEPVFDHMGIFNPEHDSENPISFVWQAILGGVTEIVRNHPLDRFATRVPYSGSFDNPQQDVVTTVFNVFRNTFVKAFTGKLENEKIDLPKKIEPEKKD